MTTTVAPTKGTRFVHADRKDLDGNPMQGVVTMVRRGVVYWEPQVDYRRGQRIKTPMRLWDAKCGEVLEVPEKAKAPAVRMTPAECRDLYARAHAAGQAAGEAATPTPMVVVERENPLDDTSPVKRTYAPEANGVCGFAWVTTPGTTAFARFAREAGLAKTDTYAGGTQFWVRGFGQAYERKMAYAGAFAAVLTEAGLTAHAGGRLD